MRGLLVLCLAALAQGGEPKWLDYLVAPQRERDWEEIGWRPTLAQAMSDAHEAKRPILLWAMNGHPLGCT